MSRLSGPALRKLISVWAGILRRVDGGAGVVQQLAEGEAEVIHGMSGLLDYWIVGSMEVDTIHPFIHPSINPDASEMAVFAPMPSASVSTATARLP